MKKQHAVARLEMHLDGAHLFGEVLRRALQEPLAHVGGELCPRIGGDVHAAARGGAHVGGNLLGGTALHRVGNKDAFLPVGVVDRESSGDERTTVFERLDDDGEPFTLYLGRARYKGVLRQDTFARRHRFREPQAHRLSVADGLVAVDGGGDGVLLRRSLHTHRRLKAVVTRLGVGSNKSFVRHGLPERRDHLPHHPLDGCHHGFPVCACRGSRLQRIARGSLAERRRATCSGHVLRRQPVGLFQERLLLVHRGGTAALRIQPFFQLAQAVLEFFLFRILLRLLALVKTAQRGVEVVVGTQ